MTNRGNLMPLVRLPSNRSAPKGHIFVERDALIRVTPIKGDQAIRVNLSAPDSPSKGRTVATTAPLADLLTLLGPHVQVQLVNAHQTDEEYSYVRRDRIACIVPTAIDDGRLRLLLANGEEISVVNEGDIASLLTTAHAVS